MEGQRETALILGKFIYQCSYEQIPKNVTAAAKTYILDIIGCILGASNEPQIHALFGVLKLEGGNPQSSVIGKNLKTSSMNAAFLNAAMGHLFDFDDDHREAATHTSTVIFPATLAVAERIGAGGKDFLRAFILGSELTVRLGMAFLGKTFYRGFHATSTCGVYGAAASASILLGLNSQKISNALGLAGSFASGNIKWKKGDSWHKPLQPGHAAMCGVMSASLAAEGFLGSSSVLNGSNGFIETHAYRNIYDYSLITRNLGKVWEMDRASIKPHACCRWGASAVDCALELWRQGLRPEHVQEIKVKTFDIAVEILTKPEKQKRRPSTSMEAQFSLPYMIATAFCNGKAGIAQFRDDALKQSEVLTLIDKICWEVSPIAEKNYPKFYYSEVDVTLHDGQKRNVRVTHPKGDPENPVSRAELVEKFNALSGVYLDETKQQAVISLIMGLEKVKNISILLDHLV